MSPRRPEARPRARVGGADPIAQFESWFADAERAVPLAEAMTLATSTRMGPDARMVLLKGSAGRLRFFTNYESAKGRSWRLTRAALVIYWRELDGRSGSGARSGAFPPGNPTPTSASSRATARSAAAISPQSRRSSARELRRRYGELAAELGDSDPRRPDPLGRLPAAS
jgi:pyridoxine/pyridoxamine 5'-phosphate oxidase